MFSTDFKGRVSPRKMQLVERDGLESKQLCWSTVYTQLSLHLTWGTPDYTTPTPPPPPPPLSWGSESEVSFILLWCLRRWSWTQGRCGAAAIKAWGKPRMFTLHRRVYTERLQRYTQAIEQAKIKDRCAEVLTTYASPAKYLQSYSLNYPSPLWKHDIQFSVRWFKIFIYFYFYFYFF